MHQGRRLQRLAGLFLSHLLGRQLPELVIDEGQELLGGVRVTLLDGRQDARKIAHEEQKYPPPRERASITDDWPLRGPSPWRLREPLPIPRASACSQPHGHNFHVLPSGLG